MTSDKRILVIVVSVVAFSLGGAWVATQFLKKNSESTGNTAAANSSPDADVRIASGQAPEKLKRAVARVLCKDSKLQEKEEGQPKYRCKKCPTFTTKTRSKDPELGPFHFGAFSNSKTREALVNIDGCEPRIPYRENGTALLTHVAGSWRLKHYDKGVALQNCRVFHAKDYRSFLTCVETKEESKKGMIRGKLNAVWAQATNFRTQPLMETFDNHGACVMDHSIKIEAPLLKTDLIPKEPHPILRVLVETEAVDISPCDINPDTEITKKSYDIDFTYFGDKLRVRSEDSAQLTKLHTKIPLE